MKTRMKFADLTEGQRFWNFEEDFGNPRTKIIKRNGGQVWADAKSMPFAIDIATPKAGAFVYADLN